MFRKMYASLRLVWYIRTLLQTAVRTELDSSSPQGATQGYYTGTGSCRSIGLQSVAKYAFCTRTQHRHGCAGNHQHTASTHALSSLQQGNAC